MEEFLSLDNQIIALGRHEAKLSELAKKDSRIIPFQYDLAKKGELGQLIISSLLNNIC